MYMTIHVVNALAKGPQKKFSINIQSVEKFGKKRSK